ncbi:MAG: winged helix-turn-helix domain-containing protein [Pseudomonadota bacterium]
MIDPVQPHIELLRGLRRLRIDGSEQVIGARAFDVLAYLDAHSGRVVTKAELLEHVWADLNVEESNLTVQIATLRKLIGARAIATVPGVGYVDPAGHLSGRSGKGLAAAGQALARGASLRQPHGRCGQGLSGGWDRL